MSRELRQTFGAGAQAELDTFDARADLHQKLTTAEEIAERLEIDVPEGVSLQMPQWMINEAEKFMTTTFSQDYWLKIVDTVRKDIEVTLTDAITNGWSTRRIATEIRKQHGGLYSQKRATLVARTEVGGALNSGHESGIQELEQELSMPIGKMWLSVLGTTTRRTHGEAHGQVVPSNGLFKVGAYEVPYPAHVSLPAKERCNCQCTVISSLLEEDLPPELRAELEEN